MYILYICCLCTVDIVVCIIISEKNSKHFPNNIFFLKNKHSRITWCLHYSINQAFQLVLIMHSYLVLHFMLPILVIFHLSSFKIVTYLHLQCSIFMFVYLYCDSVNTCINQVVILLQMFKYVCFSQISVLSVSFLFQYCYYKENSVFQ